MVITLNKRLAGVQGSLPPDLDQETFRFRADQSGGQSGARRLCQPVIHLGRPRVGVTGWAKTFRFRADRPGVGFRVLFEIKFRRPTL